MAELIHIVDGNAHKLYEISEILQRIVTVQVTAHTPDGDEQIIVPVTDNNGGILIR